MPMAYVVDALIFVTSVSLVVFFESFYLQNHERVRAIQIVQPLLSKVVR